MWHRVKVIVQCNVIIKNGRVIDGSGAPSFNSKVGIRGGILVEVDKLNSEATQVINV
jgi:N-acyl-D-aspartate/D-glutamate deacylase